MKKALLLVLLSILMCASLAFAKDDDAAKATAMVKKAVEYYKTNGLEKLMTELNNPSGQFIDGSYYVWLLDQDAMIVAHPVNAKLIGQNVMSYKDNDGKEFIKEIMATAKAKKSGWTDYKFKNPRNGQVEPKSNYYELVDDMIFCCGIYK